MFCMYCRPLVISFISNTHLFRSQLYTNSNSSGNYPFGATLVAGHNITNNWRDGNRNWGPDLCGDGCANERPHTVDSLTYSDAKRPNVYFVIYDPKFN